MASMSSQFFARAKSAIALLIILALVTACHPAHQALDVGGKLMSAAVPIGVGYVVYRGGKSLNKAAGRTATGRTIRWVGVGALAAFATTYMFSGRAGSLQAPQLTIPARDSLKLKAHSVFVGRTGEAMF